MDGADDIGWGSPRTVAELAAGIALLVAFVVVELRIGDPLVDLSLFRNRAYAVIVTAGTVANCVYCVVIFGATLYLRNVRDLSPAYAAVVFLALAVGAAISGQLTGRLDRAPPQWVSACALAVGGGAVLLMTASQSWVGYLPGFFLVGLGLGLGWAYASVGTQVVVPPESAGVASGITLTSLVTFGGIAVAFAATTIDVLRVGGYLALGWRCSRRSWAGCTPATSSTADAAPAPSCDDHDRDRIHTACRGLFRSRSWSVPVGTHPARPTPTRTPTHDQEGNSARNAVRIPS